MKSKTLSRPPKTPHAIIQLCSQTVADRWNEIHIFDSAIVHRRLLEMSGKAVPFLLTTDVAELIDRIRLDLKVLAVRYRS